MTKQVLIFVVEMAFIIATFAWLLCEFLTGIDPFYN